MNDGGQHTGEGGPTPQQALDPRLVEAVRTADGTGLSGTLGAHGPYCEPAQQDGIESALDELHGRIDDLAGSIMRLHEKVRPFMRNQDEAKIGSHGGQPPSAENSSVRARICIAVDQIQSLTYSINVIANEIDN
jgi:hypothetical protein